MDPAILSTTAGLLGSMIGATATFSASWLTQQRHLRTQTLAEQQVKREALYTEFIAEASKRLVEGWSKQAESAEVLAQLYSVLERMRLVSSAAVINAAEVAVRFVIDAYADPNRTFEDLRQAFRSSAPRPDPLQDFIDACRKELRTLHT